MADLHGPERKPLRHENEPVMHADYALRAYVAKHGKQPHPVEFERNLALSCAGKMEYRGWKEVDEHGHFYVEWEGDVWHHNVVCSECDYTVCFPTDYKLSKVESRTVGKESPKENADVW